MQDGVNVVFTLLIIATLFSVMRELERWLHLHLFKVGWLLTRNYQTTTILYYTFFLPGVFLHEVILWLVAGVVNVGAIAKVKWPEAQEIGQLKLNFVQIPPNTGRYRRAIIAAAPLVTGITIIWLVANNIFHLEEVTRIIHTGNLDDVALGIQTLVGVADFWLWVYLTFTISSTMFPSQTQDLRGWITVFMVIAVLAVALFLLGAGNQVLFNITDTLNIPQVIGNLQSMMLFIISINIMLTLILGTIETLIERATGVNITFEGGRMVTMTREEAERARQQEAELRRMTQQQKSEIENPASIYDFVLPLPPAPDSVDVDAVEVATTQRALFEPSTSTEAKPTPMAKPSAKEATTPKETKPSSTPRLGGRSRLPQAGESGDDKPTVPSSPAGK